MLMLKLLKNVALFLVFIPIILAALATMVFFSIFSFRSDDAKQDAAKLNSSINAPSDKKRIENGNGHKKDFPYTIAPTSGTTVATLTYVGIEKIVESSS